MASAVYWERIKQILLLMSLPTWAYRVRIQNKLQNKQRNEEKTTVGKELPLCVLISTYVIDKCNFIHGELL